MEIRMRRWSELKNFVLVALILLAVGNASAARRALLIGISDYPVYKDAALTWSSIHGENDVTLISGTLKKKGFSVSSLTGKNATAAAMRKAFATLERNAMPGDIVYIHFSGHGQPFEDVSGDEQDGWDEAIVPYDAAMSYTHGVYEGGNHIIDDELSDMIGKIRRKVGSKGYVYVVIDACHSGGAARGEEQEEDVVYVRGTKSGFSRSGKKFIPRIDSRSFMRIKREAGLSGVCYLEACRSYQTNCEIKQDGKYYGPLTYYINQTLGPLQLTSDTSWVENVRKAMSVDRRLVKQNMVVEK